MPPMEQRQASVPLIDNRLIPKPLQVTPGEPCSITVYITGCPAPTVRWQIGRKRVKESAKYQLKSDSRYGHTLAISRVTEDLEQGVWVVASNEHGEDCCHIEVTSRTTLKDMRNQRPPVADSTLSTDATKKATTKDILRKKKRTRRVGETQSVSSLDAWGTAADSGRLSTSDVSNVTSGGVSLTTPSVLNQSLDSKAMTVGRRRKLVRPQSERFSSTDALYDAAPRTKRAPSLQDSLTSVATVDAPGVVMTQQAVSVEDQRGEAAVEKVESASKKVKKKTLKKKNSSSRSSLANSTGEIATNKKEPEISTSKEDQIDSGGAENVPQKAEIAEALENCSESKHEGARLTWELFGTKLNVLCKKLLSDFQSIADGDQNSIDNIDSTHIDKTEEDVESSLQPIPTTENLQLDLSTDIDEDHVDNVDKNRVIPVTDLDDIEREDDEETEEVVVLKEVVQSEERRDAPNTQASAEDMNFEIHQSSVEMKTPTASTGQTQSSAGVVTQKPVAGVKSVTSDDVIGSSTAGDPEEPLTNVEKSNRGKLVSPLIASQSNEFSQKEVQGDKVRLMEKPPSGKRTPSASTKGEEKEETSENAQEKPIEVQNRTHVTTAERGETETPLSVICTPTKTSETDIITPTNEPDTTTLNSERASKHIILPDRRLDATRTVPEKGPDATRISTDKSFDSTRILHEKARDTTRALPEKAPGKTSTFPEKASDTSKFLPDKVSNTEKALGAIRTLPEKLYDTTRKLPEKVPNATKALPEKAPDTTRTLPEQTSNMMKGFPEKRLDTNIFIDKAADISKNAPNHVANVTAESVLQRTKGLPEMIPNTDSTTPDKTQAAIKDVTEKTPNTVTSPSEGKLGTNRRVPFSLSANSNREETAGNDKVTVADTNNDSSKGKPVLGERNNNRLGLSPTNKTTEFRSQELDSSPWIQSKLEDEKTFPDLDSKHEAAGPVSLTTYISHRGQRPLTSKAASSPNDVKLNGDTAYTATVKPLETKKSDNASLPPPSPTPRNLGKTRETTARLGRTTEGRDYDSDPKRPRSKSAERVDTRQRNPDPRVVLVDIDIDETESGSVQRARNLHPVPTPKARSLALHRWTSGGDLSTDSKSDADSMDSTGRPIPRPRHKVSLKPAKSEEFLARRHDSPCKLIPLNRGFMRGSRSVESLGSSNDSFSSKLGRRTMSKEWEIVTVTTTEEIVVIEKTNAGSDKTSSVGNKERPSTPKVKATEENNKELGLAKREEQVGTKSSEYSKTRIQNHGTILNGNKRQGSKQGEQKDARRTDKEDGNKSSIQESRQLAEDSRKEATKRSEISRNDLSPKSSESTSAKMALLSENKKGRSDKPVKVSDRGANEVAEMLEQGKLSQDDSPNVMYVSNAVIFLKSPVYKEGFQKPDRRVEVDQQINTRQRLNSQDMSTQTDYPELEEPCDTQTTSSTNTDFEFEFPESKCQPETTTNDKNLSEQRKHPRDQEEIVCSAVFYEYGEVLSFYLDPQSEVQQQQENFEHIKLESHEAVTATVTDDTSSMVLSSVEPFGLRQSLSEEGSRSPRQIPQDRTENGTSSVDFGKNANVKSSWRSSAEVKSKQISQHHTDVDEIFADSSQVFSRKERNFGSTAINDDSNEGFTDPADKTDQTADGMSKDSAPRISIVDTVMPIAPGICTTAIRDLDLSDEESHQSSVSSAPSSDTVILNWKFERPPGIDGKKPNNDIAYTARLHQSGDPPLRGNADDTDDEEELPELEFEMAVPQAGSRRPSDAPQPFSTGSDAGLARGATDEAVPGAVGGVGLTTETFRDRERGNRNEVERDPRTSQPPDRYRAHPTDEALDDKAYVHSALSSLGTIIFLALAAIIFHFLNNVVGDNLE